MADTTFFYFNEVQSYVDFYTLYECGNQWGKACFFIGLAAIKAGPDGPVMI